MLERLVWSWDIHVRHEALTRTNRHPWLNRWIFRVGVAVCVLIVVLSVAVILARGYGWCRIGSWALLFGAGGAMVANTGSGVMDSAYGWEATSERLWWFQSDSQMAFVPSWFLLCVALIPTVFAWRRLRRPLPGHCVKCAYDLRDNLSGRCPECGTNTATSTNPE